MRYTSLLLLILLMAGCGHKNPHILFKTELGDIEVELYPEKAPVTVANFLRYVNEQRLDSSTFYRIVRDDNQHYASTKIQVIQGGLYDDYHPKMLAPIVHETTEQTGIHHLRGTISMARNEPGTATSEFFICLDDEPELDFKGLRNPDGAGFAAFGQVVKGMDVAEKIHQSKADEQYLTPKILVFSVRKIK